MFSQKRKKLPINCSSYIDLYDKCNIGCEMCKFNQNVKEVRKLDINFSNYKNKTILFSYRVGPYVLNDFEYVEQVLDKLHDNNCKIVFLTRKAKSVLKQIDKFKKSDFVGVSISENSSKNSDIKDIILLFKEAKKLNIKTWCSLEPVLSSEYANKIIKKLQMYTDFFRVGPDDLMDYNWKEVRKNIVVSNKIFVKEY